MSEPSARVGVLLVPGTGDQRPGDTLTAMGEPLLNWIHDWLRGSPEQKRGTLRYTDVTLSGQTDAGVEAPAYARVEIGVSVAPDKQLHDSWLFCEARWGESPGETEPFRLMLWLATRGPMLVYWHFYLNAFRKARRGDLWRTGYFLSAPILAGTFQLLVTIGFLLIVPPVKAWRAAVTRAARRLALTLSDGHLLAEHDLYRASVVKRVKDAFNWLSDRVETVILIAHSHGVSVAYETLMTTAKTDQCGCLIALGSTLEKLEFLRTVRTHRFGLTAAALFAPVMGLALAFSWIGVSNILRLGSHPGTATGWQFGLGAFLAVASLWLTIWLLICLKEYRIILAGEFSSLALESRTPQLYWLDLCATHDPFPMGDASQIPSGFVHSVRVSNDGALLHDHSSYFANESDGICAIWTAIGTYSNADPLQSDAYSQLNRVAKEHRRDTRILTNARLAVLLTAIVVPWALAQDLVTLGRSIVELAADASFQSALSPIGMFTTTMIWIFRRLLGVGIALRASHGLLGGLVVLSLLTCWWGAFTGTVRAITKARWRHVCRSTSRPPSPTAFFLVSATGFVLANLPIVLSGLLLFAPQALTLQVLAQTLVNTIALALTLVGAMVVALGPWVVRRDLWSTKPWSERVVALVRPVGWAAWCLIGAFMVSSRRQEQLVFECQVVVMILFLIYGGAWQVLAITQREERMAHHWRLIVIGLPPAAWLVATTFASIPDAPLVASLVYAAVATSAIGIAALRRPRSIA